jgi:hypothetical protein
VDPQYGNFHVIVLEHRIYEVIRTFSSKICAPPFQIVETGNDEKFEAEHGALYFSNNYDIFMIIRKLGRRHTFTVISNGVQHLMFPRK